MKKSANRCTVGPLAIGQLHGPLQFKLLKVDCNFIDFWVQKVKGILGKVCVAMDSTLLLLVYMAEVMFLYIYYMYDVIK